MIRTLATLSKSLLILFLMFISACSSIGPASKLTFFQMADTQFGFFNANVGATTSTGTTTGASTLITSC